MSRTGALDWLLDDLVTRVAQIDKAVILSRDGLAIGASAGLSRDDAEHLSAVAAGFQSLARGVGLHFGGGLPRQTIVEMESAFLFVTGYADAGPYEEFLRAAQVPVMIKPFDIHALRETVSRLLSGT